MTQQGIVTDILDNGKARVCVTRLTACGGSCSGCETCMLSSELSVDAVNKPGAKPGQKVSLESSTGKIFKAIAIVYILPVFLLLAGYFFGAALGMSEGMCILMCFLFLLLSGVILVVIYNIRRKKAKAEIVYNITAILEGV